jgi:starch phosphorylase
VPVYLNEPDPTAVRVELYAEGAPGSAPARLDMQRLHRLAGASHGYLYGATIASVRPATDYTVRATPHSDGAAVPLEDPRILWQR